MLPRTLQAMDQMGKTHEASLRALRREAKERHGAMVEALQAVEAEAAERARDESERWLQMQADHEKERAS